MTTADVIIRRVLPSDVTQLMLLISAHALFEEGSATVRPDGVHRSLFGETPRCFAWVASSSQTLLGYVAVTREFSFWRGDDHLHMDCLFMAESARGQGVGARLMHAAIEFAERQGLTEMQWQTPVWNVDATRFYERQGSTGSAKLRFSLPVTSYPMVENDAQAV